MTKNEKLEQKGTEKREAAGFGDDSTGYGQGSGGYGQGSSGYGQSGQDSNY